MSPGPPALKAFARAGANVSVEWSGIIRTHYGPSLNVRIRLTAYQFKLTFLSSLVSRIPSSTEYRTSKP
jgi:hypothetical protein